MLKDTTISIARVPSGTYVDKVENATFRPSVAYPEYPFAEVSSIPNDNYDAVRKTIMQLGLDSERFGTAEWNPFQEFIKEGDYVLVKPNLVQHFNVNSDGGVECLFTRPSIVAPILDYVFKALNGSGKVVVGDSPIAVCDFDTLITESGYDKLVEYYRKKGLNIELVDFRKHSKIVNNRIATRFTHDVPTRIVNLGEKSEFYGITESDSEKLRIVNYPHENIANHHHDNIHEYCISQYVLDADVIINVPKPKTHKKAGVTISLKNIVGTSAQKDYLPHHTFGSKVAGGDEYKNRNIIQHIRGKLYDKKYMYESEGKKVKAQIIWFGIAFCTLTLRLFGVKYQNGSWYGNETISKTIVDLNKILFFADKNGIIHEQPQRKYMIMADMVISGEKDGPLAPSPKKVGVVAAGFNPVKFDNTIATLMGFDPEKIPTLRQVKKAFDNSLFTSSGDIEIISDITEINGKTLDDIDYSWYFLASDGWKGHIER